jgi:hypothetical protein
MHKSTIESLWIASLPLLTVRGAIPLNAQAPTMPRSPKRVDLTVKIDAEIARRAKVVAAHRNISAAEYLSKILDPVVTRDYSRIADEISRETKPKS